MIPMVQMSRRKFLGNAALGLGLVAIGQFAGPLLSPASAQGASAAAQKIADHFASVRTMMGEFVQFGPRGEQTGGKFYIRSEERRVGQEGRSGWRSKAETDKRA